MISVSVSDMASGQDADIFHWEDISHWIDAKLEKAHLDGEFGAIGSSRGCMARLLAVCKRLFRAGSGRDGNMSVSASSQDVVPVRSFGDRLKRWSRMRPVFLLIDDAHKLSKPEMSALFHDIYHAIRYGNGDGHVFAVVCGAPSLYHLAEDAYPDCMMMPHYQVGRLDPVDAVDALTVPMDESGVGYDEGVVQKMLDDAAGYPLFIQLWGRAAWDLAVDRASGGGAPFIDEAVFSAARDVVNAGKDGLYADVCRDMGRRGLMDAAVSVAHVFSRCNGLSRDGSGGDENQGKNGNYVCARCADVYVYRVLSEGDPRANSGREVWITYELLDVGYIWRPKSAYSDFEECVPGIMGYVRRLNPDPVATGVHSTKH